MNRRMPGACAAEGGGARRVSIRGRFFVCLRRVVGATKRKRTENRAELAPPQPVDLLPRRLLVLVIGIPLLSIVLGITIWIIAAENPDTWVETPVAPLSKTNP